MARRIVINVSGDIYETFETTLRHYPRTLLGDYKKRRLFYCHVTDQYFFHRNRACFAAILYFYQSKGVLLCPPNTPVELFQDECNFFEIPENSIERMKELEDPLGIKRAMAVVIKQNRGVTVWDILDDPTSSTPAKLFASISLLMISASIVCSALESMPSMHVEILAFDGNHWLVLELVINIWFQIEFSLRLIFCPSKLQFVLNYMNWIDGIAVIPYFIILLASDEGIVHICNHRYLRILRFLRIIRLFRLSQYSMQFKLIGEIVSSSMKDIQLLILCIGMIVVFGGSIMYVVEENVNTQINSTPDALWWAVQTITTVGYGDVVAETLLGKLVAICMMAFGAITMTLPILAIVTKFTVVYSNLLGKNKSF